MGTDFPAAHSMDTSWYAVDREGHVAYFWSGESGAVPVVALVAMRGRPQVHVRERLEQLLAVESAGNVRVEPAALGLFDYEHADRFESPHRAEFLLNQEGPRASGPYVRRAVPPRPLHVDQLPPAVRAVVAGMRFDGLAFADERAIQPVEHVPCQSEQSEYVTLAGERRPFPERPEGR
jgi:hypothetical protein